MSRPSRRLRGSVLFVLAFLLMASGAIRLGMNVGHAMAGAQEGAEHPEAPPLDCPQPPVALTAALQERESRARAQETALAERMAALDLAQEVIDRRMAELAEAESGLRATLALADSAAEKDLAQLTEVYQTMKPKDAARLFNGMDPQFAAGFLGRMGPQEAAAILSGMTEERAYAVSALMAGRNANVPKE